MSLPFKICPVVRGSTIQLFLKNLKEAERISPLIELRVDTIKGFKEDDVKLLKKSTKAAAIFTCRHVSEGGEFAGDKKVQHAILKKAFQAGFKFVDIAYGNSMIKSLSSKEKKKLVLSYHSFQNTPSFKSLKATLKKMRKAKPAVIKMATMVKKEKDILILADLLSERKAAEDIILIGMGKEGMMTRILFPLMGSYLTYVAIGKDKIAPGLMTYKEMREIYNAITKS
ncbi:MAG TPA: type I 3-dehydroquinate dehydratase [Bacteroidia bacterium]|jgi:3-dehydroquinate dehydratase type I|nr:type I 3-dehydroquinate dehydratase [Bacteroidia bacterium]